MPNTPEIPDMSQVSGENVPEVDAQELARHLIDSVKAKGYIRSSQVEAAFRAVPRHLFLPHLPLQRVYKDEAIVTKSLDGRSVSSSSQPTIMAIMLEQLDLREGQRVLEIGAGTGYNAALMAHIVGETGHVVTIDIDEDIVEAARANLHTAGYERVQVVQADGGLGFPDMAPYDRIILTVNADDITPAWHEQLAAAGRILLPLSVRIPQLSVAFKRVGDHLESVSAQPCGFIGLRGAFASQLRFVPLDPEPGQCYLTLGESFPVDVDVIEQWLRQPTEELQFPVELTKAQLFYNFNFWLALYEPRVCMLNATRSAIERGLLPDLFPLTDTSPSFLTLGVLGANALSVLKYSGDMMHAETTAAEVLQAPHPMRIAVRTYGNDAEQTQKLFSLLNAWNKRGRLNERDVKIRAYRHDQPFVPTTQDVVVQRPWTRFVFRW